MDIPDICRAFWTLGKIETGGPGTEYWYDHRYIDWPSAATGWAPTWAPNEPDNYNNNKQVGKVHMFILE